MAGVGGVEILVNNAGIFFFGEAADAPRDRANALLQLHVVTPSLLCTLFGREMRERGSGRILVVSSISPWREAWRRFQRHRLAYYSLWVLGLMVLAVLIGPLLYKVGINDVDFQARLAGPSAKHPMGTDDLGRDMLARMLYGGRFSLAVGLASMLMAITVGVIIGSIAGMARGWVDAMQFRQAIHKFW